MRPEPLESPSTNEIHLGGGVNPGQTLFLWEGDNPSDAPPQSEMQVAPGHPLQSREVTGDASLIKNLDSTPFFNELDYTSPSQINPT